MDWLARLNAARASGNTRLAAALERDPTAAEEAFQVTCPDCGRVLISYRKIGNPKALASWRSAHEKDAAREDRDTHYAGCCGAVVQLHPAEDAREHVRPGLRVKRVKVGTWDHRPANPPSDQPGKNKP
jgi:predicted RNA-binding Zn-ribbon protein involved in translation (DUF1610 family)